MTQFDPEDISSQPMSVIVDSIKACRRRANKQAYTTAYHALLTYCVNSDSDKSPTKSLADFMPYPQEEEEKASSRGPFDAALSDSEFSDLIQAMKSGWIGGRLMANLANIDGKIARSMGL